MAWLDRNVSPLYHTTGNHTTYDPTSEAVFREMLSHLPRNGPSGQEGLSYFVRHGDLLMVFVNTACSALGGEGRVEIEWLDRVLNSHPTAAWKLVLGHHPAFSVNGFSGPFQRNIEPANGEAFWQVLVRHRVLAYLCSHILAFDVQVHDGVLQILTAGAGTAHRMPAEQEYLHCLQAALDPAGLRYQVLDVEGHIREWLNWPMVLPHSSSWKPLQNGMNLIPEQKQASPGPLSARLLCWEISGSAAATDNGAAQTFLSAIGECSAIAPLWIGLLGPEQRLCVLLSPASGRSPHLWHGPTLTGGQRFSVQVAIHTGMGPGGMLWRRSDALPWSSLAAASPWGAERLSWLKKWSVGHDRGEPRDKPFRGNDLNVRHYASALHFNSPSPTNTLRL